MSTAVQTANSALRGECVMSTPVQTANSAQRGECVRVLSANLFKST